MKGAPSARESASKTSFDDLLGSNARWLEWIEEAIKFEGLLKDKVPWDNLDGPAKTFISQRLKTATPAKQVLLNSFYLTMVSGFEEYLRTTIQEVARRISNGKPKYDDLPEAIRRMYIRESAKLLKRLDSPPDYLVLSFEDLCRGLGSCVPESNAVVLSPEAFAELEGLIKLDSFIDRLAVLGVKLTWDILGKHQAVKSALSLGVSNTRQTSKALQEELETMARYRNRIAHTGGNAADVTPQIVNDHRLLMQALASVIETAI